MSKLTKKEEKIYDNIIKVACSLEILKVLKKKFPATYNAVAKEY